MPPCKITLLHNQIAMLVTRAARVLSLPGRSKTARGDPIESLHLPVMAINLRL
jgi:hypothetical protein